MGTPDIQTPELMIDIKTVNVQSRTIHTDWRVESEPLVVYYSHEVWKQMCRCQKTINFVKRLKKRYNEKDDFLRYRNILTVYGFM